MTLDLDIADMGPRIVIIVAIFLAFNAVASVVCGIVPGWVCVLVFIVCNVAAGVTVKTTLFD